MKEYNTVLKEGYAEIVEKKSRFICSVKPVNNEAEAIGFIEKISTIHKNASHNVFAYIVAGDIEIQRASDDGEPQGTAGIPVLEVIKRENLINVCVVVTRYFGGTLLGASGLIRAYSSCAKAGLHASKICRMALYNNIEVEIDYTYLGKMQNVMAAMGNAIVNTDYTDKVKLYIKVRYDRVDNTTKTIKEITNGEAKIETYQEYYDVV